MKKIKQLSINGYKTLSGQDYDIKLSYEVFGRQLVEAPIILVNHALTGNSNVCGLNGWWSDLIGPNKCIDTNYYCVLAFNVPGNGYDNSNNIITENYKGFVARDIAKLFSIGLDLLNIDTLFAIIGGSVGGGIAWELATLRPKLAQHLIPIASDWKSTDWLISNCYIQDLILNHSNNPIADARIHAMTLYRTPESLAHKFNRSKKTSESEIFNVESWLNHHGNTLEKRFNLSAYKMMNHILKTIDITRNRMSFSDVASKIRSNIHIITINSDLFFKPEENWTTYVDLKSKKENVWIHEIKSIHGHDAFLIEFDQLQRFLNPIFSEIKTVNAPLSEVHKCA
ncbi:alpha/beta fold hydrolase [Winogradskyella sp. DF17]|uniref:Alpha/beta fold hydrolase n=1 Tax=Winogradskyella pelagia TaxID=2819984 RepID=A0ABS3SZ00_9FLAO|nr:alpha/beta fold hydrolase [Winogradskyella sp. DF17]MBO3115716.1 alpha/beta fold hydrolase [Winogradskyella sp. DF17]